MSDKLRTLIDNMIESYIDEEAFGITEMYQLDEAVEKFNELPPAWMKQATRSGLGGKDSKVEVLAATKKIKDVNSVINVLRKSLRREGAALVWIEMGGEPLVAVQKDSYANEYTLLYPQGSFVAKNVKVKHYGTGKWDRRMNKYIEARYYDTQERSFKPTEAVEQMWNVAWTTLKNINDAREAPKDSVWDLAQEMKFEVRMLTADENRQAVKASRLALKRGPGLKGTQDSLTKNRKAAVEKVVMKKVQPIIDQIKSDVEAEVNKAIAGDKYDFKTVEDNLKRISNITSQLKRFMSGDGQLTKSRWKDEKPELSWDLDYLMKSIKDI